MVSTTIFANTKSELLKNIASLYRYDNIFFTMGNIIIFLFLMIIYYRDLQVFVNSYCLLLMIKIKNYYDELLLLFFFKLFMSYSFKYIFTILLLIILCLISVRIRELCFRAACVENIWRRDVGKNQVSTKIILLLHKSLDSVNC